MSTDPVYVTFEFRGNLGEETERVRLGIKGLGDESASTYKRLLASSNEAFEAMSANNRALAVSIQEDIVSLRQLAAAQKAADEAFKEGKITATAYAEAKARMAIQDADLRRGIQDNIAALNQSIEQDRQAVGSIEAKKEALDRLFEAYRKLSEADRAGQEGKELLDQISGLSSELRQLEGAYKGTTKGNTDFLNGMSQMPGPLGQAAVGIQGMTKAAMAFIATPLGMIIAAIAAGLAALTSWFRRTEEGQNALAVGSAAFSAVLNNVLDVVDKVGEWLYKAFTNPKQALTDLTDFIKDQLINRLSAIADMGAAIMKIFSGDFEGGFADFGNSILKFATGVEDAGSKLADFYDKTNERAQAAISLAERRNALDVMERNALKEKADLQVKLNNLRNKAYDTSIPEQERVKYLKEALAISDTINNKDIAIAKEKYEIQKASNTLGTSLSKEDKRAEVEAYSAFKDAEAKMYSARNMMQRQLNGLSRTEESFAKKRAEAEAWLMNKQKELTNEQIRTLLDAEEKKLSLEQDGYEKRKKQNQLNYERELLAIKEFEAGKMKEALEVAKRLHQEQTGSDKGFDFSQYKDQLPEGLLPADIADAVEEQTKLANAIFDKTEENLLKSLTDKYLSYADKRLEIETKFNKDIAVLRAARDNAETDAEKERLERSIAQATADRGKELISFDLDRLKESPLYIRAFEDLKNTSNETLNALLGQLEEMKARSAEVLKPNELREYTRTIQQIVGELISRNPFEALASSQRKLAAANAELTQAKQRYEKAQKSDNTEELANANEAYVEALNKVAKSSNDVTKAQKSIREQTDKLYSTIQGLGDIIGGSAGEIIRLISDIGTFVNTTIDGINSVARTGAQALSAVEKASVILGIISAAIQLLQELQELLPDSHDQYLDFASKIGEINKLRDAVNEYKKAVLSAKHAEESWFATDGLQSLKQARDMHEEITRMIDEKLNEDQAKYQNEEGGGWSTDPYKWFIKNTYGKIYGFGQDDNDIVKAKENLRIETRAKTKGVLGSGWGAKDQKTEDLITWVKNNLGLDLFDEGGMIDAELGREILSKYGDKMVGQTKETIETLIEYKEQYDEYVTQLREYVASLYEPLVDNMVDALWDWFDEGKDALDSFKDYAAGTFRDIVSDMLRTIIMQNVIGTFSDDIKGIYEQYSAGDLTEEMLAEAVASRTGELTDNLADKLPAIQEMMTIITDSLKDAGIDLAGSSSHSMADSIANNIIKGFAEGKRTAADFADDFEEMLKNAVLQGIKMKALEEPLRQWYEDFAAASDNGLTEEKIAELREQYDKIIADAARQLEDAEKITGVSIDGSTRSAAAKGLAAAMSQDSANELNGNFNAMLIYLKNTTEGVQSINNFLVQGLSVLTNIERNTAHLEGISKNIGVVASGVQEMVNKGLIMRSA